MQKRIVTSYINPPIPIRYYDWCAFRDGEEENGGYGYGKTEQEAIDDLLENERLDGREDDSGAEE